MGRDNAELRAELAMTARGPVKPHNPDQPSVTKRNPVVSPLVLILGLVVLSVAAGPLLSVFGNPQYIALGVFCFVLFGAVFACHRSHRLAYVERMQAAGMSELDAYRSYNARYGD
jgi:hypothetical protein